VAAVVQNSQTVWQVVGGCTPRQCSQWVHIKASTGWPQGGEIRKEAAESLARHQRNCEGSTEA
jgi:hypothetical protein